MEEMEQREIRYNYYYVTLSKFTANNDIMDKYQSGDIHIINYEAT